MPRPISVPKGSISAPSFRLIGSQTLRQELLKYANTYNGTAIVSSTGLQTRLSGCVLLVAVAKIGATDECLSSFMGGTVEM